jgi:hypothetical protein
MIDPLIRSSGVPVPSGKGDAKLPTMLAALFLVHCRDTMGRDIEYVFCITTGRSGSHYLANIFKHASGCRSFHEPEPIGNGLAMRCYLQANVEPMRTVAQEKVLFIKEAKRDHQLYIETNHCFIKGFGWFIPHYLPEDKIGVIILKREKSKIAKSLLRIGCSPLTEFGRDWVSTPEMKDPLVAPPKKLISPRATYQCARLAKSLLRDSRSLVRKVFRQEFQDPQWLINYELECLEWYVEETHEKAEAFKQQYPGIKYYNVNIEDLNSLESVQEMFAYFGCSGKNSLTDVVGKPTNLKRGRRKTRERRAGAERYSAGAS